MKGQYLAVESGLTFGIGIILAIGVIGAVDIYSQGIYQASEEAQASIIQNKVLEEFNTLRAVEGYARTELELPESAGNSEYYVEVGQDVTVVADGKEYEKGLPVEGPVTGSGTGSIRIVKSQGNYELSDR